MIKPFEIPKPIKGMDKRTADILDGLIMKAQGLIEQYEILGFEFLRIEIDPCDGEMSIVFGRTSGDRNEAKV